VNARWTILPALLAAALSATPAGADYGPPGDVRAARAAELHRWHELCPPKRCAEPVLDVIVVERFALIDWSSSRGQGQSLLEYAPTKGWYRLTYGGGEMGEGILAALTGDVAAHKLWTQYERFRHRR
jgi:hypothetical protein